MKAESAGSKLGAWFAKLEAESWVAAGLKSVSVKSPADVTFEAQVAAPAPAPAAAGAAAAGGKGGKGGKGAAAPAAAAGAPQPAGKPMVALAPFVDLWWRPAVPHGHTAYTWNAKSSQVRRCV